MRKHLAALLPLLVLPLLCANAAEPQFRPEGFRAHVAFLADDLLEGRDTGSRGHEIAARYVAAQFEAYGLRPGGDVGSWFQSVTLQKTERGTQRGTVTVSGPAGMRRWPNGGDVIVGLNPQAGHIDLDAPVVFVGYGIENDRLGLNDYQGLDVKGRIVVALSGFPKGMSSEEGAHVAATKAQAAQRHGAIGFVGIGTLQSIKVHPWEQVLRYVDTPDFDWVGADGKVFQEAPGILASASLNTPAAVTLFAGSGHTLEAVRQDWMDLYGGRAVLAALLDRPAANPLPYPGFGRNVRDDLLASLGADLLSR